MGGGYASLIWGRLRLFDMGEATPLWLGIDRVGSGLCLVAFIKKPLYDDPVKG
jgi:hypothetical protein